MVSKKPLRKGLFPPFSRLPFTGESLLPPYAGQNFLDNHASLHRMKNQKPSEDPVADNLQIHVRTFQPSTTQAQALETLTDSMAEVLDDRQLRHIKNAVLLREETQTTSLDHGLAVPHGRTSALDSMQVTVGISPEGVLWPDDSRNAHLIVMLGVPAAMVTGYLTTMQKLLRWHKNAPLGPNGEWTGDEASLLASLQQALQ